MVLPMTACRHQEKIWQQLSSKILSWLYQIDIHYKMKRIFISKNCKNVESYFNYSFKKINLCFYIDIKDDCCCSLSVPVISNGMLFTFIYMNNYYDMKLHHIV